MMSLTFIDPLSENFAYLSPVIYCPSCAQLVFNTLPAAPRSSSLNTAVRGCHGGQYFTARPRQQTLPDAVGRARPPPTRPLGPRCTLTVGQGVGGGQGPSEHLLLTLFKSTPPVPSSSGFFTSILKRQPPAHQVHETRSASG